MQFLEKEKLPPITKASLGWDYLSRYREPTMTRAQRLMNTKQNKQK